VEKESTDELNQLYLGSKDGTLFNGPILVLAKIIKKCYGICSRS
jgi:hypothetical protein